MDSGSKCSDSEYYGAPSWEWQPLGVADPGSGGPWEWRTLGVADPGVADVPNPFYLGRTLSSFLSIQNLDYTLFSSFQL